MQRRLPCQHAKSQAPTRAEYIFGSPRKKIIAWTLFLEVSDGSCHGRDRSGAKMRDLMDPKAAVAGNAARGQPTASSQPAESAEPWLVADDSSRLYTMFGKAYDAPTLRDITSRGETPEILYKDFFPLAKPFGIDRNFGRS
ncbi:hypothetical protein AK812_SmicGene24871 [Symbiodinium microadriaticum]|uniref:Uncharacterized protein n=1 Tax=Symbiodinium microadriaticum TaxID=2951 RepID=A0A1Q9DDL1_SYMMI|nr:hypothetical protein AK812_SmicGene24871 [Symbiodinium microadriaticum]